jgi:hypothetical protein
MAQPWVLVHNRRVLRSRKPGLVRQEFFGWVLMHYTVRWLLHQGAARHRIGPMLVAPPERTRLRRAWSKGRPRGSFII